MALPSDQNFFAAYRGYYTEGTTFLQIIGLSRNNNQSFHVRESKLNERGIKLGDFLSATVPLGEPVKNFALQNHKLKVIIDGNYAKVEDQEADLEKNTDGILVFRSKTFGLVRSLDQNIPIGRYKVTVRGTRPSEEDIFKNMKYSAEVKEPIDTSSSSSSRNFVVGTGFSMSNLSIGGKKSMTAFVYNSIKKGDLNTYFLWICDNHEKSIFTSKTHNLSLGHFFEAVFEEKSNAKSKWQCIKYLKQVNSLLEGSIIANKIELKTKISQYQPTSGKGLPTVYSEHLGTIIDNKKKLPESCEGRQVKTQMCKVGDDFEWVVTELL